MPLSYPSVTNAISSSTLPAEAEKTSSSDYPSAISKTMPASSYSSTPNVNSHVPMKYIFTPVLSSIFNEFVTFWFQQQWLIFVDNHTETFLILNPDIKNDLTVQMAINQNLFVNSKVPLLQQPECVLIRTEPSNRSLILPNSVISLEHLFDRNKISTKKLPQGKLIAIIRDSDETNSRVMFYKHSPRNHWYIYQHDQSNLSHAYSNILSNEQLSQLESILKHNDSIDFIDPSQLVFPLSVLCNHPIIYVYLVQEN